MTGDLPKDTGWSVAELESFRNGRPGLATDSWGLYCIPPLPPPPRVWGNLACGARVSSTPFESAGFPQSTVADFRMTLPEAEVNQPSQPPLSIFSLGEGTATSFIVNQLYTDA